MICACGRHVSPTPENYVGSATYADYSYLIFANCSCKSTVTIPIWLSEEAIADEAALMLKREPIAAE